MPTLKIISHHMGGMIPYFSGKINLGFRQIFFGTAARNPAAEEAGLKRPPIEYFKLLFADTALNGEVAPTRCGHALSFPKIPSGPDSHRRIESSHP
jgi:aminocarboxymuconate-semialdehyde decarboxylase